MGRLEPEQDIDVAKAKIRVHQQHILASVCERDREVDGHIGLADSALAARDRDHARPAGPVHRGEASGPLVWKFKQLHGTFNLALSKLWPRFLRAVTAVSGHADCPGYEQMTTCRDDVLRHALTVRDIGNRDSML